MPNKNRNTPITISLSRENTRGKAGNANERAKANKEMIHASMLRSLKLIYSPYCAGLTVCFGFLF